jgi:MarR family transcriptional regulator, lower aerobic nicotinate degradation pathway regulator
VPADLPVVGQPPHRCSALLDHLARRMRAPGEQALSVLGLRPRHMITLTVLRDFGPAGQQQLAEVLDIDRTNLVGLLNELEAQSWIVRRRSPEDRRRHVVELTTSGRGILARAELAFAAVEDHVLAGLSVDERETLYGLLFKAADELTQEALLKTGAAPPAGRSGPAGE